MVHGEWPAEPKFRFVFKSLRSSIASAACFAGPECNPAGSGFDISAFGKNRSRLARDEVTVKLIDVGVPKTRWLDLLANNRCIFDGTLIEPRAFSH
jgi:hypothetical protein